MQQCQGAIELIQISSFSLQFNAIQRVCEGYYYKIAKNCDYIVMHENEKS